MRHTLKDYHKGASTDNYLSTETTVIVALKDEDDMNPLFEYPVYSTEIRYSDQDGIQVVYAHTNTHRRTNTPTLVCIHIRKYTRTYIS